MLARDHLCKIFHYASMGASSVVNAKRNDQYAQIFFEIARRAGYRRYKNPYFIVFSAITTMRAQIWSHVACTQQ